MNKNMSDKILVKASTKKPKKVDLKKKRRGGFYWKGETPYVSVTTILKVIDKPALRYWYGKEVYYAMVKNPSISESEALKAPYNKSVIAQNRGTTVHSIVEVYKNGTVDFEKWLDGIDEEWRGYAKAFLKWIKELNVNIIEHERSVFSEKHQYAGTCDLLAKINNNNHITVVDVKTGKNIYPESFLQTSAYQHALMEEGQPIGEIGVLLLDETGHYKYKTSNDRFEAFLACKKLWEGLNYDSLKRLGYLK